MMNGCIAIMTRARRQEMTRPTVKAMNTMDTVWTTKAIRSPTSDLTYNTKH
jgi:uncharacterized protein YceK